MKTEGRLRWAIFTNSVVSDVENPDAHLWRALGRQLRQGGHEATFFEPRGNDAVRALLQRSGSRALSDFRGQHPDIEYRTLDPRQGPDLVEWLTRTLATADVALMTISASPDLINWIGKFTRPHLQTFAIDTGWNVVSIDRAQLKEPLAHYSAIALGDARLVETYRAMVEGVPIFEFGPLPQPDLARGDVLEAACQRLMDGVVTARIESSRERQSPMNRNGHRPA